MWIDVDCYQGIVNDNCNYHTVETRRKIDNNTSLICQRQHETQYTVVSITNILINFRLYSEINQISESIIGKQIIRSDRYYLI